MTESVEALNNRGIELSESGDFSEAIACYKRAITLEKENYILYFNLGIVYQKQGDFQAAKIAMETALKFNYAAEILESLAVICLELDKIPKAMFYCQTGLEEFPDNAQLLNTLGVIYFKQGEYENAAEAFEHAVSVNPYYYDALFNLRDTYSELGNAQGEAECQERLLALKNSD